MTAGRPGHDAGPEGPHTQGAYGADGAFVAAVDGLADPLNDPLPGGHASPWFRAGNIPGGPGADGPGAGPGQPGPGPGAPDPVPDPVLGHVTDPVLGHVPTAVASHEAGYTPHQGPQQPQGAPNEWYDPVGYQRDWYGPQEPSARIAPAEESAPAPDLPAEPRTEVMAAVGGGPAEPRTEVISRIPAEPEPDPEPASRPGAPPSGGRAERRRAAKGRGGRRRPEQVAEQAAPAAPMSRVEARRAAKAAKDSPAVVASRVVGEVFISLGVLMLLFVTYQLWWTNIRAEQIAGKETNRIQDEWANGDRKPGVFAPGQGFAIMHIPKLDVVAPIAEGIDKEKVLDRGMIGHYGEGRLKTAMPSDKQGNFSVAGHRNTHGEPFRYINKLNPGDPIVVETQDAYYTYEMASILPQTSPSNISVIEPVPAGSGFEGPGRYLTLTTCTPEFTSTYRLIVWGKMVDERPRSQGKPDALVG
ncbi:class E sortase [Streptomyces anulatus]|uniref:class E sortase n=1 Tax=Streptomyces anulatus TaxID=1892 RepID=UPI00225C18DF|nr:class E sortase [Streptomyces anulatus]MCX4519688.1 class E sortase [Streptomyces anulatus]MCX4602570.1 class E sortase [Streptomyces anulatus]